MDRFPSNDWVVSCNISISFDNRVQYLSTRMCHINPIHFLWKGHTIVHDRFSRVFFLSCVLRFCSITFTKGISPSKSTSQKERITSHVVPCRKLSWTTSDKWTTYYFIHVSVKYWCEFSFLFFHNGACAFRLPLSSKTIIIITSTLW